MSKVVDQKSNIIFGHLFETSSKIDVLSPWLVVTKNIFKEK